MSVWKHVKEPPTEDGEYIVILYKPGKAKRFKIYDFFEGRWLTDIPPGSKWRLLKWTEIPEED